MKIKICGLKYPDNIQAIEALGPQYMGFIFYGRSPRFAGDLDAGASAAISPDIIKTGVFVNESAEQIKASICSALSFTNTPVFTMSGDNAAKAPASKSPIKRGERP